MASSEEGRTGRIDPSRRERILQAHGPAAGDLIQGRYQVRAVLGEGGHAEVLRVLDVEGGEERALKLLYAEPDATGRETLETSLELLVKLHHPNLVRTFDAGTWNGRPYLVTEYLPGETLRQYLVREGPLRVTEAARLLLPVLVALDYLHGRGVVHRDVKPHNVMLSEGSVKLLDYGLARRLGIPTSPGADVEGTAEYIAPEALRGDERHRADLYGAAVVLHEMLTGRLPFTGEGREATAMARVTQPLTFGRGVREAVPPAMLLVLARGLQRDPDRRFRSAREMSRALEEALARPQRGGRALARLLREDQARLQGRDRGWARVVAWVVAAGITAAAVTWWAAAVRDVPASVRVERGGIALLNVWGSVLARRVPDGPPPMRAVLSRGGGEPARVVVAWEGVGRAGLAAYPADPSAFGVAPLWTARVPVPGYCVGLAAASVSEGQPGIVSVWDLGPDVAIRADAPAGGLLGEVVVGAGEVAGWEIEPPEGESPATVWLAVRETAGRGLVHVRSVALPAGPVRAWGRVPAGDGPVHLRPRPRHVQIESRGRVWTIDRTSAADPE